MQNHLIHTVQTCSLTTRTEASRSIGEGWGGAFLHTHYNTDLWKISRKEEESFGGSGTDEKSVAQFSKEATPFANPGYNYKFNGMEMQEEFGTVFYDFGARNGACPERSRRDPALGRWMNVDPMAEVMPSWSPYTYTFNNPVRYTDPTGMVPEDPSTDVTKNEDGIYTVVDAFDDGDNNIYVVDAEGCRTGEVMGRSIFADEFIDPESGAPLEGYKLIPNTRGTTDNNWVHILRPFAKLADNLDLIDIASESNPGGLLDIKQNSDYSGQARQFKGLGYATNRTAGNFLAGYNARRGTIFGLSISFTTFQKLAGAVHQGVYNNSVARDIVLNCTSYGPAPYFGEIKYQYRASLLGWRAGSFNYLNRAGGKLSRDHLIGIDK